VSNKVISSDQILSLFFSSFLPSFILIEKDFLDTRLFKKFSLNPGKTLFISVSDTFHATGLQFFHFVFAFK
jgi:hypothetical protein